VTLSGQRQKIAARNFARFFVKLMLEVIRLTILHEQKEKVVEVAGNVLNITPQAWKERKTCTTSMHLGYGEKDKAVAKHSQAYQMLAQDPAVQPMFTAQNRFELIRDTMKLAGLTGAPRYITSPDKVQPPQPDPLKVQELQIKDKQANAAMAAVQVDAMKHQQSAQEKVAKLSHDEKKLLLAALQDDHEQQRKDADTASRITIAEREMKLAEDMPAQDRRAVVAPAN
jgi:anaerobic selenocysteine-containing dehydrogenase